MNNSKEKKPICLNNQTVGNLKRYLEEFPDDARVVIHAYSHNHQDYKIFDCQIGCNIEHQKETNRVILLKGWVEYTKAELKEMDLDIAEMKYDRQDSNSGRDGG